MTPITPARRRATCACTAVLTLLAAAGGASSAQAATLSAGRAVTPPNVVVEDFDVATSARGGRVALVYASRGTDDVMRSFARLGEGRNLGPIRRLEPTPGNRATSEGARVAVSTDGSAVAAWIARGRVPRRDQLRVATAAPGRGFGRPQTLLSVGARRGYVPRIALVGVVAGPRGRAVVAWSRHHDRGGSDLRVAVRPREGRFGSPQTLRAGFSQAQLALAPPGTVVVAWLQAARDGSRPAVAAAQLPAGARRFRAARTLSGSDAPTTASAAAGPGGAGVAWTDHRRSTTTPIRVRLARLRRDGTFAPPVTVAAVDPTPRALQVDRPTVAFPLAGPVASWHVLHDISEAGDGRIDMTRVDAAISRERGAAFLAPSTLSTTGPVCGPPVAAALLDRALVAWPEQVTSSGSHLRLAVRRAGGSWEPAVTFARPRNGATIAIAAGRRRAVVAWLPFDQRVTLDPALGRVRLALYG
jgi:hypothetical protein